jgi:hypothetical protein
VRRRVLVKELQVAYRVAERRACRALGFAVPRVGLAVGV